MFYIDLLWKISRSFHGKIRASKTELPLLVPEHFVNFFHNIRRIVSEKSIKCAFVKNHPIGCVAVGHVQCVHLLKYQVGPALVLIPHLSDDNVGHVDRGQTPEYILIFTNVRQHFDL